MPDAQSPLKIAHVVPSFFPAHYFGGPTESVYSLCRSLSKAGAEVRVLTTDSNGPGTLNVDTSRELQIEDGVLVRYCHRIADVSISPQLLRHLPDYIKWADVVHLTAVYSFPTIPTLVLARLFRKPIIWSPRGSLERWENTRRIRTKAIWEYICRVVAPSRTVLHVTSDTERDASTIRMPFRAEVIPNGVTIRPPAERRASSDHLPLLYLGRLDPQKGLDNLLDACKLLKDSGAVFSLRVVGDGARPYPEQIHERIARLQLCDVVEMAGYLGGDDKEEAFRTSDVLVLPSFRENFGMAVAEALARGLPVIAAKGTPWSRLETERCGLWVENSPESLAQAIQQISHMQLSEMGIRGREWMRREFSWDSVADRMMTLYRAVADSQLRSKQHAAS